MTIPAGQLTARAAELGIGGRTLRRYVEAGLVTRPTRGVAAAYPVVALAQVGEVARGRMVTRDIAGLRHRLWWEGLLPDGWEAWRADRLPELEALVRALDRVAAMTEAQADREARELAEFWASWRDWPYRQGYLRTAAVRESGAAWLLSGTRGDPLPQDLGQPFDGEAGCAAGPTVGAVMDRVLGVARRRELGLPVPGEAGEFARGTLAAMSRSAAAKLTELFALVTEGEARRLRDGVKALERLPENPLARPLRETPELAAVVMGLVAAMAARCQAPREAHLPG